MASQGPNNPSSATGGSSGAANIYSSNNVRATIAYSATPVSLGITATGFGFSLPANIEIVGIKVEIEAYCSAAGRSISCYLYNGSNIIGTSNNNTVATTEQYDTYGGATTMWGLTTSTLTKALIESSSFGIFFFGGSLQPGETIYIDHARMTVYYVELVDKPFTDTTATGTDTFAVEKTTYDLSISNNNQAYVLDTKTGEWTFISNCPFSALVFSQDTKELKGSRRDLGNVAYIGGDTFDGTSIASVIQTGFFDMEKEGLKRLRALFSEIKASGTLTLTVYTDADSTGQVFTITPGTQDNVVYNQIRTALSRDIRGKFVSFKIENNSGCDFWIGKLKFKGIAREVK